MAITQMTVRHLLCGYRRSGKDTTADILCGINTGYNLHVYTLDGENLPGEVFTVSNYKQVSYAKALKDECHNLLKLPSGDYESSKDTLSVVDPYTSQICVLRDVYINVGAIKRSSNINHWVDTAYSDIKSDESFIVKDLRFINEYNRTIEIYGSCYTSRIFRSDVPIPDANIESEHQLDDFTTNFLLLSKHEDFDDAVKLFPQYKDYSYSGKTI